MAARSVTPVDIDALLSANVKRRQGARCQVCTALEELAPATRDKLVGALVDKNRYTAQGLATVLTELGHGMSRSPVERHRRGDCRAGR